MRLIYFPCQAKYTLREKCKSSKSSKIDKHYCWETLIIPPKTKCEITFYSENYKLWRIMSSELKASEL